MMSKRLQEHGDQVEERGDVPPDELVPRAELLNEKIKQHVRGNWLHNFEVDASGSLISAESYAYRRDVLDAVFGSLLLARSVLVLDEVSGFYPALIHRAGAASVTACSADQRTCDLITEVSEFLDVPTTVVKSKMLAFYDSEPYVDTYLRESHEFLLALGQIWPLFGTSGESFDAIVEACAFFVTDGLVFDWTDASWASPPPPATYNLNEFCTALRKKFDFVMSYSDWFVVAVGKLPTAREEGHPEREETEYDEFVDRFRARVCRAVPRGATVVVVSKGDSRLLQLEGRIGWHFPPGEDGEYAGYYPSDSTSAIEHVEALQAHGADFLVFPQPAFWWLDHYREFHEHLARKYALLLCDEETCMIFTLAQETSL